MEYIIDRIEGNIIVLEDTNGNIINYSAELDDISFLKEGEVIVIDSNNKISILKKKRESIKTRILNKTKDLWE